MFYFFGYYKIQYYPLYFELTHAAPSGVNRHLKYLSKTQSDFWPGTGPVCGVWAKYMTAGLVLVKAGHVGTPSALGLPYLAKLIQYVPITAEIS